MTQHYVYSLDTTKCLDLWQKIYQILYLFLWNLTIHNAIRFRAGGTGGARARPGGNLPAIQFLVDVKVAFLLQVNPLLQLGTASPLEFWTIRQSCGLHVCLIFLTHLFVCISKTVFFLHQDPLFYKYENIKPGEVYLKILSSEVKEKYFYFRVL